MDGSFEFNYTTLNLSEKFNAMLGFKIGSIYNKNLAIRNITLMRNIGKYKMYDVPMYPEIGTIYNVYEKEYNRPVVHYEKGGLLEWNNDITTVTSNPSMRDDRTWFMTSEDSDTGVKKDWFSTNSGSVGISGGSDRLKEVKSRFNSFLATKRYYYLPEEYTPDSYDEYVISNRKIVDASHIGYNQRYTVPGFDFLDVATNENISATTGYEGRYVVYDEKNEDGGVFEGNGETYNKVAIAGIYSFEKNGNKSLLMNTNRLFSNKKIKSIIGRYYTEDEKYSRGRNLRKEGGKYGNSFESPYCRVWTVYDNYYKVKDMIRPFVDESGKTLTLEEVQKAYGDGYRPFGAKQLSEMSVLKSNGFVNISPHLNKFGNLNPQSIRSCMFSIENLAWKDIQLTAQVNRKLSNDDSSITALGPVLSKSQLGPNGGRIMWFPPYNIKFTENINTQWNDNSFIGRGEKIYTYVNTDRSGTLSFTLLIDHPSVVDKWTRQNREKYENDVNEKAKYEEKVLRFFAGCGTLADELDDKKDQKKEEMEDNNKESDMQKTPLPTGDNIETLKIPIFFPNYYTGIDEKDEMAPTKFVEYLIHGVGTQGGYGYEMTNAGTTLSTPIPRNQRKDGVVWKYMIDNAYRDKKLSDDSYLDPGYSERGVYNYSDLSGFSLNKIVNEEALEEVFGSNFFNFDWYSSDCNRVYSFYELYNVFNGEVSNAKIEQLKKILSESKIVKVNAKGFASQDGTKQTWTSKDNVSGQQINDTLSRNRCKMALKWFISQMEPYVNDQIPEGDIECVVMKDVDTGFNINSLNAKITRCAMLEIQVQPKDTHEETTETEVTSAETTTNKLSESKSTIVEHYDDEYLYFEHLKEEDSFLHNKIVDKVKYFDPAFHSITPEGFNARLTFLNQCTRQGPTIKNGTSGMGAGNLAFGRAPYCVLRIGDFYNTKICIDSITISYDNGGGVQWDLNPEGAGVQPMYADVNINFRFIGGSDLSGPIEKLQNAVSFNYYSNTSVYDRRSDLRMNSVTFTDSDDERRKRVLSWEAPINDPKSSK